MPGPCQIEVFDKEESIYSGPLTEPLELGRQSDPNETLHGQRLVSGRRRLVVARLREDTVSRQQALIEPRGGDRILLKNLSSKQPVHVEDGADLAAGASRELALPATLLLGRDIRVEVAASEDEDFQSLEEATMAPGTIAGPPPFANLNVPGSVVQVEGMLRWLQTALNVLQSAASSDDFFQQAARAAVDLVRLDSGRVLLLKQGHWNEVALHTAPAVPPDREGRPSRDVLKRVLEQKRTFWQLGGQSDVGAGSLLGVKAVVAAPILDRQGEVIGALYGDRRRSGPSGSGGPLGKLEAMLVELLAGGVAAGLARLVQEEAAVKARVQFEQFFTPELSRQLQAHPDLLEGRDCEVTLLCCDIRGFSRISEQLEPGRTLDWLRELLGALSDCVLDQQGVLVDYWGDELLAMWGAPGNQPDHAAGACRAALAMLACLPQVNERWQTVLGEPVRIGIGLNTGIARVGNTGSHRKFKYGPHGPAVNLASRIQGATKYLKKPILMSGPTRARLDNTFLTRRLCRAAVVNIVEPVELHELAPAGTPGWQTLQQNYEHGLAEFEKKEFRSAAGILGPLLTEFPEDGPTLVLLSRALQVLAEEVSEGDSVWHLPGK